MTVLALDQSSRITGWSIFEDGQLKEYGKFNAEKVGEIPQRLAFIRKQVQELIEKYQIQEVVFEDIQLQQGKINNVQTFKVLAEVYGTISCLLVELGIPQTTVLASVWKSTLGIKGKDRPAQKKAAQEYVFNKFSIKPTQDEVDSICIGLHYTSKKSCAWA